KILILNKRNHDIQVKMPTEFRGATFKTVDASSGEQEALPSTLGDDLILHMKANAVTVIFEKNASQRAHLTATALIPFWKTDTMHNESVLIRSVNGEIAQPRLLFTPKKIISVSNSAL